MSRLNTNAEVLHKLTEVGYMDDVVGGGSTTLHVAGVVGDATISVHASTNFIVGDFIRIERNEKCEITKIEGASPYTFTLRHVLEYAHPIDTSAVVEIADVPVGETTTDGISYESNTDETPAKVGTQRGIYLYIPGSTEQTLTFALLNFSLENLAMAFGQHDQAAAIAVSGAGSVADPYVLAVTAANYAEQEARVWYAEGMREDAKIVRFEWWNAKIYSPQVTIKVTTGEATPVPLKIRHVGLLKVLMWA